MEAPLAKISKQLRADDRKVGGSLMRIHRDLRFSKDKTPYKTNLGIQFRHSAGKDVHAPGVYIHVGGDGLFMGAGLWRPDREPLADIRAAVAKAGARWPKLRDDPSFRRHWSLGGESLSRPPKGYDGDHPHIEDIKRRDFIAVCDLKVGNILGPDAIGFITTRLAETRDFMRFLCKAIGLPF